MSHVEISAGRRFYWSVRRELWESRSIYLAPIAVASLVLIGFLMGLPALPARVRLAAALGPDQLRSANNQAFGDAEQAFLAALLPLLASAIAVEGGGDQVPTLVRRPGELTGPQDRLLVALRAFGRLYELASAGITSRP